MQRKQRFKPMWHTKNIALVISVVLAAYVLISRVSFAAESEQVCNTRADYYLGIEDYPDAIRLHAEIVRRRPTNALAHYHLGFALGMAGDRIAEETEYRIAQVLGARNWDLFLNLGLAELEEGDTAAAINTLHRAVVFGEDHPESHYNLALVEEQRGMLKDAERETLEALRLDPFQPDERNLLGIVYAQQGMIARASQVWHELARDVPNYEPARENLDRLGSGPPKTAARRAPSAAAVTFLEVR